MTVRYTRGIPIMVIINISKFMHEEFVPAHKIGKCTSLVPVPY